MTVSSQWVEAGGVRVHYLSAGTGEPVLLLHGGGADSAALSWRLTIEPLAAHTRVLAPDWPGYGASARPAVEYTAEYYIAFLGDLLDALGLARAALVGVSMGGGIALGFTLRWPARVTRLVLADSYGLQAAAPAHRWSWLFVRLPLADEVTWALTVRSPALARALLRNIFYDPRAISDELADEVLAELRRPGAGRAFTSFQRSEMRWRGLRTVYMDRLHEIRVPTLIVHGAGDRLVPLACAREAHARIPGSRLRIIPECGHWPQREKPSEFNAALLEFLTQGVE